MNKFDVGYLKFPFSRNHYSFLSECISRVNKRLYIQLTFEEHRPFNLISRKQLLSTISDIYGFVLKENLCLDPILLLPFSKNILIEKTDLNAIFLYKDELMKEVHNNSLSIVRVENIDENEGIIDSGVLIDKEEDKYKKVACGGTFDHFHSGHKILLTAAVMLATEEVIVGVSDGELLKNKKYKECLQSYDVRQRVIRSFLSLLNPSLTYSIPQLLDVGGPTLSDPTIEALSVSEETLSGASFINQEREKKGWDPLTVVCIPLVSNHSSLASDSKLSSTSLRQMEYELLKKRGKIVSN